MTRSKTVLAYHFTNGYHLRDGQLLETGREYVFDGTPMMCESGYHASQAQRRLICLAQPF